MNKRLQQFLTAENITQSQFAESINVARASVSHILSGRNKPSFDFIESVMLHYPTLNPEWLITGKGKMYNDSHSHQGDLFDDSSKSSPAVSESSRILDTNSEDSESIALDYDKQNAFKKDISSKNKKIVKVIVYYSDYSYTEII